MHTYQKNQQKSVWNPIPSLNSNSSPLKIGHPQRKLIFQPQCFRCYFSFREGNTTSPIIPNPEDLPSPRKWHSGQKGCHLFFFGIQNSTKNTQVWGGTTCKPVEQRYLKYGDRKPINLGPQIPVWVWLWKLVKKNSSQSKSKLLPETFVSKIQNLKTHHVITALGIRNRRQQLNQA